VHQSGDQFSLRIPMVVGPRYIPAQMDAADAARITPAVLRPDEPGETPNPVTLSVEVQAGVPIGGLRSASHSIETGDCSGSSSRAVLRGPVPANKDFVLDWTLAPGAAPAAAALIETKGGRHYGLVMVAPPAAEKT
jgi:Ca-activated chloride channel family protein